MSYFIITAAGVAAAYFLFRFLLKLSRKPVLEISLVPIDNPRWKNPDRVTSLIAVFQENGFDMAGHYKCPEIPSLVISGFVKPSEQLAGAVYDHPAAGIWADVYVQYADGSSLTASNAPTGSALDHMPQQAKIYSRESDAAGLIRLVLKERRKSGGITITKDEFATNFAQQYLREMKWRLERGGPTSLEVMRVAISQGKSPDSAKLLNVTRRIQANWREGKSEQRAVASPLKKEIVFPTAFEPPDVFRRRMEQAGAPVPRLSLPSVPVYVMFGSLLSAWSYYGYRYNEAHFPVSFTALIVFLLIFLVLFVMMMAFREYHRRVRMYPVLKRMADFRTGAFVVIQGNLPTLFYARENWIGRVSFEEGDDSRNAFTRLDAVTGNSAGWLSISRKNVLNRFLGGSDKDRIPLPESDFSRKFEAAGSDRVFAERILGSDIPSVMMRLAGWKEPSLEIDRNSVVVNVGTDLSETRKERELRSFLEAAESIVETAARQSG